MTRHQTSLRKPGRANKAPRRAHNWQRHPHEWYVEERWTSERFLAERPLEGTLLDPACGFGQIVLAARAAGLTARGSDIRPRWRRYDDYRPSHERFYAVGDFLNGHWPPRRGIWRAPDIIMSNPPFRQVRAFLIRALALARRLVILLLPANWQCGATTSAWLETTPLACVYPLGPRPSMPPGEYLLAGKKAEGGRNDFAWYEWAIGYPPRIEGGRPQTWPIRRDLEAAA